jgi:putative hydrolase of the HAD superfamily
MIEVIFFDAIGTLFHLPHGVGSEYAKVARAQGFELDQLRAERAFYDAWKTMPVRAASGQPRPDDDKGWWKQLVSEVLSRSGCELEPAQFETYFENLYAHFAAPGVWVLYPEVQSVLQDLTQKFRLAVISNFDRRLHAVLSNLKIDRHFSSVVISSEVGVDKPHPAIFKIALKSLGVQSADAIHVGDDPKRDWAAARRAGLQVFELKRPESSLHDLADKLLRRA